MACDEVDVEGVLGREEFFCMEISVKFYEGKIIGNCCDDCPVVSTLYRRFLNFWRVKI